MSPIRRMVLAAIQCCALTFIFAACGKDSHSLTAIDLTNTSASVDRGASLVIAPCATCDCPCEMAEGVFESLGLYAGSTSKLVGSVTLAVSGSNLVVTITMSGKYTMSESHLNVNLTPPDSHAPGLFQYQHTNLGSATTDVYTVPLAYFGPDLTVELYIAISVVVGGQTATAWNVDCRQIFPDHDWKSYCHFHLPPCDPIQPNPPANVSASDCAFTDRVQVTWSAVVGATAYEVYRSATQSGTYTLLGTSSSSPYNDFTAGTGQWWYKVVAAQDKCKSDPSAANSGQSTIAAPVNVQASDCGYPDKVRIMWAAVPGATSYTIYRSATATGTYSQIGTSTTTNYSDFTAGTSRWYYKVGAESPYCSSALSLPNGGNPSILAPANVQASDCTHPDKVVITWDAVAGAQSYTVYRASAAAGPYTAIGTTPNLSWTDSTVGTSKWWYKVGATSVYLCESAQSASDPGNPGIGTPLNVQASDCTYQDKIVVTWSAVPGALGYTVYRASASAGPYTALGSTTTATTWTDTAGITDQTWWYRVSAASPYGCDGAQSAPESGYACPPSGPCKIPDGIFETLGLYASSTSILVGSVTLAISGDNLIVTIKTNSPYTLSATHLYIGSTAPAGANPGGFPWQHGSLPNGTTVDTYTLPLALFGTDLSGGFNIAVSAVVGGNTATAWNPDCRKIFPGQKWKSYCDFEFPPCQ